MPELCGAGAVMAVYSQVALARRTMTSLGLRVFGWAAAAPLVVLAGGIPGTYAATGVTAVPLVFALVTGVVALLLVGYAAMARRVGHPAAYYGIVARGLGRGWGVAAGLLSLVAYNAIQISLYGLFGAVVAGYLGGPWWVWAGLAVALVAVLGVRAIVVSTRVMATVLAVSLLVVLAFVVAGAGRPAAGGLSWEGFHPSGLAVSGVGGALALCVAAFMGVEAPGSFIEEAVDRRSISRAMVGGVLVLGVVYAAAAWAMGVAVGPGAVAGAAADPALPWTVLGRLGGWWVPVAEVGLVFGIVMSMLAFHAVLARYVFAMAREQILPAGLARTGVGTRVSAPRGGSLTQTGVAVAVVAGFAAVGADPMVMFVWLSTLGAMGLLCLLLAASLAASRADVGDEGWWQWRVAPWLGLVGGVLVLGAMVVNVGSLLGAPSGSWWPLLLPVILAATAMAGGVWAVSLRRSRPDIWQGIGEGTPSTHAVPDAVSVSI